jgi:hypothetical protein
MRILDARHLVVCAAAWDARLDLEARITRVEADERLTRDQEGRERDKGGGGASEDWTHFNAV